MQIHGPHGPNGLSPIFPTRSAGAAGGVRPAQLEMPKDEIDISPEAQMLADISQTGEVRNDRIEEVRRMIASGVYETPERLSVAVDRLLDELGGPAK